MHVGPKDMHYQTALQWNVFNLGLQHSATAKDGICGNHSVFVCSYVISFLAVDFNCSLPLGAVTAAVVLSFAVLPLPPKPSTWKGLAAWFFCAFFISDAFHTSKIVWINYFNSCKAFDHFPKEHEFHIFWKTNENLVGPWAFSNASKLCGSKTCLGFGSKLHQWARSLMQGDFLETSKSAGNAKFRAKLSKNSIRWHLYEGCSKFFHVEKDIFSFAEL